MTDRNYYCNMKFRMMKIDAERKLAYNCDPATPYPIDFVWLEENPGQLFNTPRVVHERELMLNNQRNSSCENCCFRAEDVGAVSPRITRRGYNKTHHETVTQPEIIDFTIGSDCNLTCSYCVKEYSSAWRRDLLNNGDYAINFEDDRYTINIKDRVMEKNSQPTRVGSKHFQQIINELELMAPSLKSMDITGGEPMLNNSLLDIIDRVKQVPDIKIFTGLGVDIKRLANILAKLKEYPNVRLAVSAESVEKIHEFNRYGVKWDDFLQKINLIKQHNIYFSFHSTLSNLTVISYCKFRNLFADIYSEFEMVYKPDFMAVYVLDDQTKDFVIQDLEKSEIQNKEQIIQSIMASPTELQKNNIKKFLKEFTRRRPDLDVTIYPKEFLDWIEYVV